jgi:hypothetical protein
MSKAQERIAAEMARRKAEREKKVSAAPARPRRSSADHQGGQARGRRKPGPSRGWWDLIKRWIDRGTWGRLPGKAASLYGALLRCSKRRRKAKEGILGEYTGGYSRLAKLCGEVHNDTVGRWMADLELAGMVKKHQLKKAVAGGFKSFVEVQILDVPPEPRADDPAGLFPEAETRRDCGSPAGPDQE